MKKFIKSFFVIISILLITPAFSQTFPTYFPLKSYTMNKGKNSYLRWINDNADSPTQYNDAIIFATSTKSSDKFPKDLLRLTIAGVATFNSPFPGYSQAIELRNQGTLEGKLRISGTMFDIEGHTAVNIGTTNQPFLFQVNDLETTVKNYFQVTGVSFLGLSDNEIGEIPLYLKSTYGLFVKKGILSEDYSVAPIASWADFVFNPTYQLKPLKELEEYIKTNEHLPDVPSEDKVAKEGYSQHELNKILLQKIEELTLYIIAQQKEINSLKDRISE